MCSSHLYPNGSTLDWHVPLAAARVASGAGRAAIAAPKLSRIAKLATALLQHQLSRLPRGIFVAAGPN